MLRLRYKNQSIMQGEIITACFEIYKKFSVWAKRNISESWTWRYIRQTFGSVWLHKRSWQTSPSQTRLLLQTVRAHTALKYSTIQLHHTTSPHATFYYSFTLHHVTVRVCFVTVATTFIPLRIIRIMLNPSALFHSLLDNTITRIKGLRAHTCGTRSHKWVIRTIL
jgi:hypothetical protein